MSIDVSFQNLKQKSFLLNDKIFNSKKPLFRGTLARLSTYMLNIFSKIANLFVAFPFLNQSKKYYIEKAEASRHPYKSNNKKFFHFNLAKKTIIDTLKMP